MEPYTLIDCLAELEAKNITIASKITTPQGNVLSFNVLGFHRTSITLISENGEVFAKDNDDDFTPIRKFEDLVFLNFLWWIRDYEWRDDRQKHYQHPDADWLPYLLESNLIKPIHIVRYEPTK